MYSKEIQLFIYYSIYSISILLYYVYVCAQSCPTLCDHMDYTPSDSSVHGIFQARILEWVPISFSILYYVYILFQVVFLYRLLQNIKYSSQCYIVGSC